MLGVCDSCAAETDKTLSRSDRGRLHHHHLHFRMTRHSLRVFKTKQCQQFLAYSISIAEVILQERTVQELDGRYKHGKRDVFIEDITVYYCFNIRMGKMIFTCEQLFKWQQLMNNNNYYINS